MKYDGTDTTLELPLAGDRPVDRRRVRAPLPAAVWLPHARQGARHRGDRGRGRRPQRVRRGAHAVVRAARRRACAAQDQSRLHRRRVPRRSACTTATTCVRAMRSPDPRSIRERNATTVIEPGWRATLTPRDHLILERVGGGAAHPRDRHHRRSGAARGVQQPVHGDRRADGRDARQHRVLGQHQGASRFLLRAVRRRRQPHRQRAAHAGSPGLDGRVGEDDHRPARGHDAPRRRVRAQCAVQRRHAPAGRHGDRAGLSARRRQPEFFVASRGHHADIGGITPGSMPPDSTHVEEEGVLLDNVQLVAEGRFLEAEMRAILERRPLSVAQRRESSGSTSRASTTAAGCAGRGSPRRRC